MVDDAFGHWLAGFIDGEGCFRIHTERGGGYYACHFSLKLRDDDRAILDDIIGKTGIGFLKADLMRGTSKPAVIWTVYSKADCLKLIDLLDRFPLRAKKRRDYDLWREAVLYWVGMKRGNRWHGPRDWSAMIAFKNQLAALRAYT